MLNKCERIVIYDDGIIEQSDGSLNPRPQFEVSATLMTEISKGYLLLLQSTQNELMALKRSHEGKWETYFLTEGLFPIKFKILYGNFAIGVSRGKELKLLEFAQGNAEIITECELAPK